MQRLYNRQRSVFTNYLLLLYLSRGTFENEPPLFCEPGLLLLKPDGTLDYAAMNSASLGHV
jgi:hypothetical protein